MFTRYRKRSNLSVVDTGNYEESIFVPNCSFANWYQTDSWPGLQIGSWKQTWDTVTPNFRQRIMKGEVIFNPFSTQEKDVFYSGSDGKMTVLGYTCSGMTPAIRVDANHWYYVMCRNIYLGKDSFGLCMADAPSSDVSASDLSSAITEAATSVQSKVRSGDTNLLESAAQFHQAMDLFRKPLSGASQLTSTFLQVLRNQEKLGSKFGALGAAGAKFVSGEWLKYRYGILPIINDTRAIMKTLSQPSEKIRKTEHASVPISGSSYATGSSPSGVWGYTHKRESHTDVLVRATTVDEYLRSFQTDLGLDFDQIPRTLWNLIPFSFVVDWFINVDDFINAVVPKAGVTHLGGCISVDRTTRTWFYTTSAYPNGISATFDKFPSGSINVKFRQKDRSVGLPAASLRVKRDFRFAKPTRILDASSLTVQNLQRIESMVGSII